MVLLYSSDLFLEHVTGAGHPECPERLSFTLRHLESAGLMSRCRRGSWDPLDIQSLCAVHSHEQVERVRIMSQRRGGRIELDTPVSARSFEVAASAAGAAAAAVDAIMAGPETRALCLVRPPGHHATHQASMGFCLFNNIALAAHRGIAQHNLERILIVDWDVHHGNGTQDIFYEDPRVMFFSIHRYPFYPGTGASSETGRGAGLGFTRNEPIAYGTSREVYVDRFDKALAESAAKIRPELVLISAGFDAHRDDPIGSLGLEVDDFARLTRSVLDVAQEYSSGRVVSLLEGGYNIPVLARCVESHLHVLVDH